MTKARLSPLALGLSVGITWGLSIFLMGLLASYLTYGTAFVSAVGALYIGYEASIIGSVIGGVIGFVDAFIVGVIIAWLYNAFSGCCKKDEQCK